MNSNMDWSSTGTIQTTNGETHANSLLMPDINCHIWNTTLCDSVAQATLPILNLHMPCDNTCHHDSSTNCHVFHDRSAFEDYKVITPLTVKGFGHNLSALAIGQGNVHLEGFHNHKKCSILLQNVLHIPTARTNLISGIQLDKSGIVATLGHNTVQLRLKNKVIVSSKIMNDMYQLNMNIIKPQIASLALHITDPDITTKSSPELSLVSQIGTERMTLDFYITSWGM
jgi:Pol polyprotein